MHKPQMRAKQAQTIRVELVGANCCYCAIAGAYACASDPVVEMCRILLAAGHHPSSKLACFRGGVLSLTVHSIGQAVQPKASMQDPSFDRIVARMVPMTRKSHWPPTWAGHLPSRTTVSRRRRAGNKRTFA